MFFIYNQTKNPWEVTSIHDNVLRFTKTHKVPKADKTRATSIIGATSLFGSLEQAQTLFKSAVGSELDSEPIKVSSSSTGIIFNRKAFQPFISESKENQKDTLLLSFNVRGKVLKSVKTDKAFLLEYLILGGELSLITTINNEGGTVVVELWDKQTESDVVHTFKREGENITHTVTTQSGTVLDENRRVYFKKFRPAHVTHYVLVQKKDRADLETLLGDKQYQIVEFDKATEEEVIQNLLDQKIRAVTLFANTSSKPADPKSFTFYKSISTRLVKNFATVYKLYNDKTIFKLKY